MDVVTGDDLGELSAEGILDGGDSAAVGQSGEHSPLGYAHEQGEGQEPGQGPGQEHVQKQDQEQEQKQKPEQEQTQEQEQE